MAAHILWRCETRVCEWLKISFFGSKETSMQKRIGPTSGYQAEDVKGNFPAIPEPVKITSSIHKFWLEAYEGSISRVETSEGGCSVLFSTLRCNWAQR